MLKISKKLIILSKSAINRPVHQRNVSRKFCVAAVASSREKFITFDEMINKRKSEAEKSLLVQVNSEQSYPELYSYCSQFGDIQSAFHYKVQEEIHFILLEYNTVAEYKEALKRCEFNMEQSGTKTASPFVWFKAIKSKKEETTKSDCAKLQHEDTKLIDNSLLHEELALCQNVNDQIRLVHERTKLNELGCRLRFIVGRQLEMALSGLFPNASARLFGSSVNGFGKMGCDVDLVFQLNDKKSQDSRLIYHSKISLANERTHIQRQMDIIGDILHFFMPAVGNVRKILNARVPIIRYHHECVDLEIDFSMTSLSGFYMSELLYLYGETDERVRPLVFCIRNWASSIGLTSSLAPGRWITNFSITLMVIYFLQSIQKPILPPLNDLVKAATSKDIRVTDDDINCTFLRDLKSLKFETSNQDSLQSLLIQFFEFYSSFDFRNHGMSLIEGKSVTKLDHSAIWITNPLEPLLNVSKNVSFEELEKLKFECKNAAWVMETSEKPNDKEWGLLALFKVKKLNIKPESFFKPRIVDVSDLFENSQNDDNSPPSSSSPTKKIQFKNSQVKVAVKQAQKETLQKILHLRRRS